MKWTLPAISGLVFALILVSDAFTNPAEEKDPDRLLSLLTGANAVIELDERHLELDGAGSARMEVKKRIKVLNSSGAGHSNISLFYNSFQDVSRVRIELYNSEGERLDRVRTRDMRDEALISGFSVYEDSRVKTHRVYHENYPYTIEVTYRIDYDGFIRLPAWIPVSGEGTMLKKGVFTVTLPDDLKIDFKAIGVPNPDPVIERMSRNETVYRWEIEDYPPVKREVMGPPLQSLVPVLAIRTDQFQLDGEKGSLRNWNDFALWMNQLWEGRDELPEDLKSFVDEVLEEESEKKKIISRLYQHLQNSTRYVSIQLGIGGYQTDTAESTRRNRYGDCKALSNYLLAMLKYAGIEAYPALIQNGQVPFKIDPDFVYVPFNHVVVYIPMDGNGADIWVEATSNTYPAGYIGSSNSNRFALIFHENGGELIETPLQTTEDNYQFREAAIKISPDGRIAADVKTSFGGRQHEQLRMLNRQIGGLGGQSLRNMISVSNYDLHHSSVEVDPLEPRAEFLFELEIGSYATAAGSRLIFHPNMFERRSQQLPGNPGRKQPVHIRHAYHDIDQIAYTVPEGFTIEVMPENRHLQFEYGTYHTEYVFDADTRTLHYERNIKLNPGILPPGEYDLYREFVNGVTVADSDRVVLVKGQN